MRKEKLGSTNLEVSKIAVGCGALLGGAVSEGDAVATLRAAFDAGINFFLAPSRPAAQPIGPLFARAFADVRAQVVLAAKIGLDDYMPREFTAAVDHHLQQAPGGYLDLVQLCGPHPRLRHEDTLSLLDKYVSAGKVRAVGVANFGRDSLLRCVAARRPPACDELPYNLLFRAIEGDILPACQKHHVPVVAYIPLMRGLLSGRFNTLEEVPVERSQSRLFSAARTGAAHGGKGCEKETFEAIVQIRAIAQESGESVSDISLAWVAGQKGIVSVAVGVSSALQAKRNARAGDLMLSPALLDRLSKITRPLKDKLGPNPDPWEAASRIH